jgi:hypothetical protein
MENLCSWPCSSVACRFSSAQTWLLWLLIVLSSEGHLVCVKHDAGEPRLCSTALEKPMTKLLSPGIVLWDHCLNCLPMIWVQLLLMHDLPNGSVRCMYSVRILACAGWCVSNNIQDRFLNPRSVDSPPPVHNHVC